MIRVTQRWWHAPDTDRAASPSPDGVKWATVMEQADAMLRESAAEGGIMVVHGPTAAMAACAAMCLQADASFRPSSFRSHFPSLCLFCNYYGLSFGFCFLDPIRRREGEADRMRLRSSLVVLPLSAVAPHSRKAAAVEVLSWHVSGATVDVSGPAMAAMLTLRPLREASKKAVLGFQQPGHAGAVAPMTPAPAAPRPPPAAVAPSRHLPSPRASRSRSRRPPWQSASAPLMPAPPPKATPSRG